MKFIACLLIIICLACPLTPAQLRAKTTPAALPQTIPARIKDGDNKDIFVMTLGDVQTPLADGIFDSAKDEVRLKDGSIRRNYYKETLGIKYFKPIDKSRFPVPPSGWCSWYFYYQEINEDEIKRNARWIADNLKDYGAEYVQIDDGWQGVGHGNNNNRDWTTIDKRFSGGMPQLAAYIKSLGLKPGIWLAPHGQSNPQVVKNNPNVFLLKADGTSASDTWEGNYLVDPSTAESQKYLKNLFSTLRGWGFEYFKIDGQPVVTREYRNKKALMKNPTDDTDALYRQTLASIREGIGEDGYLLGCWVVPLEGVGMMNGSRVGADVLPNWDGFKFALRATMEYYFLHNVAWYADPDVMIVRSPLPLEQARAWATLQGLTGLATLTSDRLTDLSPDRVEFLRRVYPAVDTRPLDLFKSPRNKRIWDLKVNHLDRKYDVVGVFNFDETKQAPTYVGWKDLGLPENKPVHVFDFWNKEYLGAFEKGITIDLLPTSARLLTLLPATDDIRLISTSRHITQGWIDLISHSYNRAKNSYAGKSKLIKNDPYELRFVFPRGKNFVIKRATARGAKGNLPVKISNHQGWATVEFISPQTAEASWEVEFEPAEFYRFPVREPSNLWAEKAGLDGVNLRWSAPHQPAAGYQVSLDGQIVGFTTTQIFALRGLDAGKNYKAEVKTVWQDGKLSDKKTELRFAPKQFLPSEFYLSDLEPFSISHGWRQPEIDRTFTGKGLSIKGQPFEKGIGMPTNSEIEFEVKGVYDVFSAFVGLDDEFNDNDGSVDFILVGDGKELWRRDAVKKSDGAVPVNIDLKGVQKIVLRVRRTEGQSGRAHADWVDAKLVRNEKP